MPSHPTWVRGLKLLLAEGVGAVESVAPHVGAWIETLQLIFCILSIGSHPTWVRGLKPDIRGINATTLGRTPRGCVD